MSSEFQGAPANDDGSDAAEGEGEEWAEWYRLTPLERWRESEKLWEFYLAVGGSLDAEPDSQSPFYFESTPCRLPVDGGPSLRVVRRGGV